MVARINTVAFSGIDVQGVRSALHAPGIALPPKRLMINLALAISNFYTG